MESFVEKLIPEEIRVSLPYNTSRENTVSFSFVSFVVFRSPSILGICVLLSSIRQDTEKKTLSRAAKLQPRVRATEREVRILPPFEQLGVFQ